MSERANPKISQSPPMEAAPGLGYLRLQIVGRFFKLRFRFAAGSQREQQGEQEKDTE